MTVKFRSNLTAGVFAVFLGVAVWLLTPLQVAVETTKTYGVSSRTLPYGVAVLLVVCGVGLVFQSLVLGRDTTKELNLRTELTAVGYMAVLVAYVVALKYSFIVSLLFLGTTTLVFMKSRKPLYYGVVVAVTAALYLAFRFGLHATLP